MTNFLTPDPNQVVYAVDDHPDELLLIRQAAESVNVPVQAFDSPSKFLREIPDSPKGCVIVDLNMPEMSGLELFNVLKERQLTIPVIVMTGQADVVTCRRALQDGVFDFVEKGWRLFDILEAVDRAIRWDLEQTSKQESVNELRSRLADVSPRELDVMNLLSKGASLKDVSDSFGISVQTASKHRKSLFGKLSVSNEVELLNLLLDAEHTSTQVA